MTDGPIRVLVVDDSPTAREMLCAILGEEPDIVVVGQAADGEAAVREAQRLRPDLITMDIYMPGKNGLEATAEILISAPAPIIIVSSAANDAEVDLSLEATTAGALTIVAKPEGPGSPNYEAHRSALLTMVRAMSRVKVVRRWRRTPYGSLAISSTRQTPPRPVRTTPARAIAMAASTGGPVVLHSILATLPRDFGAPILVVQHIANGFLHGLAHWLADSTLLDVKIAEDGERAAPGTVYLAPDNQHLGIRSSSEILLSSTPPIGGFRPSANFLFRSTAEAYGSEMAAVILTGMGSDGVQGLEAVHGAGGTVIAQSKSSCVVYGMPGEAVAAGVVDEVLNVQQIAGYLAKIPTEGNHGR